MSYLPRITEERTIDSFEENSIDAPDESNPNNDSDHTTDYSKYELRKDIKTGKFILPYLNNTYISIITTHQARLRCLLSKIFNKSMKRFKNGCVLKMVVTKLTITFELVYSGEVSKIKPGYEYYISPNDTQVNGTTLFDIDEFTIPNNFYNVGDNERFIFYLIRHGEASHNVKKGLSKMFQSISGDKDTSLTSEGIEQAKRISEKIKEKEENLPYARFLYLFSSDLKRTRETMVNFINELFAQNNIKHTDLIVLPCAHELNYKKDGNCDGSQGISANENIMSCDSSRQECMTEGDYKVNWGLYETFYDGTRTKSRKKKQQCRNTDMIKQAIDYINNPMTNSENLSSSEIDPDEYFRDGSSENSLSSSFGSSFDAPDGYHFIKGDTGGRSKRHRVQNKPLAPIPATSPLRTATLVVNTLTKRNKVNKKTKREIIKKNKKTRKQKNKKTRKQRKQRKQRK